MGTKIIPPPRPIKLPTNADRHPIRMHMMKIKRLPSFYSKSLSIRNVTIIRNLFHETAFVNENEYKVYFNNVKWIKTKRINKKSHGIPTVNGSFHVMIFSYT